MFYFFKSKSQKVRTKGGYTFMELVVVISIFSIISSVILFNFSDFSTNISIQNTTADIALVVKEAQSDAIAGRLNETINLLGVSNFKPAYGIHFDSGNPSGFIKFTDLDKDYVYGGNCSVSNTECLKDIKINGFDQIADICVRALNDTDFNCDINSLDISFERPFPDAKIRADSDIFTEYNDAKIILVSSKGLRKSVIVGALGNIMTQDI